MPRRRAKERGQASVELIVAIPVIVLCTLVAAQLALAGYALWTAGTAARAGARAAHVGGNVRAAAKSAIPEPFRGRAELDSRGRVDVRVLTPSLVPGLGRLPVHASTMLDPIPGDG